MGTREPALSSFEASAATPAPAQEDTYKNLQSSVPNMDPLHLDPPPRAVQPRRNFLRSARSGGTTFIFSRSRWKQARICVRTRYCLPSEVPYVPSCGHVDKGSYERMQKWSKGERQEVERFPYIVVGLWSNHHNFPRERLLEIKTPEMLFREIRLASWRLRPAWRRIFSLKRISGFSIYACNPIKGYHSLVEIDHQTEVILADMFGTYQSGEPDYGNRWLNWVEANFNQGKDNPGKGKYALQLVLRWSPSKILLWGSTSIILSLVIGFWYTFRSYAWAGPSDYPGIVQTAWTIASYIVSTAGVAIALLAAVTQVGDV